MLRTLSLMPSKSASGVLIVALALLGGKPSAAAPPPEQENTDAKESPASLRELSQVRRQLLQTWIDYQMVRLDLYGDLGLSPPER